MQSRSAESEVLLLCARQRVADSCAERIGELCRREPFHWNRLFHAAVAHQIAPLVLTNLSKIGTVVNLMPAALVERWKLFQTHTVLVKKSQRRLIGDLVGFFGSHGRRVMLLKGAALDAVVYEQPWYIRSADVDLMVDMTPSELGDGHEGLRAVLRRRPVELDLGRHHDVDMNGVLDIDYARVWRDARPVRLDCGEVYLMSPEDMLLTACTNLCRKGYRQLKGMMAIQELMGVAGGIDWGVLARHARACGANGIVFAALTITAIFLGGMAPEPAVTALGLNRGRRWALRGLSHLIGASLFHIPSPPREATTSRIASQLLRIASYRVTHLWREVQAQRHLKRYRTTRAEQAAAD